MLHWSFLHTLSLRVTDLCRRLNSAFRAGSLGIYHCLRSRFFIPNASRYRRPWVVTRAKLASRRRQSLQNGAGEVLNACVDCHPVL